MLKTTSLLVILRPAKGRLRDVGAVSQKNLAATVPAAGNAARVQEYFAKQGFVVHAGGGAGGNSFSIEASVKALAKLFDSKEVEQLAKTGGELSLGKLPRDIQDLLEAVSFSPPPDFGPTNFV
jgi:hypothetical protein